MLSKYFVNFNKKIINQKKKTKTAAKGTAKKVSSSGSSKKESINVDVKKFKEILERIIPKNLAINSARPISSTGFSPEGADLIIYRNYCDDILELFDGAVPQELVYGTVHFVNSLNKKNLGDALNRVSSVKKINYFSDNDENNTMLIPSFIICAETEYSMPDLKDAISNYYISNNIEHDHEMDILVIFDKGLVVKNWREKRSYIALETTKDTMMWFYVLLNEYLDINRGSTLDMRKYIRSDVVYPEY